MFLSLVKSTDAALEHLLWTEYYYLYAMIVILFDK
jgi:hypothetical protein